MSREHIQDVPRATLKAALDAGEIALVDVREPHEFARGHIPGSVLMPLSSFDPEALRSLEKPIVFSCAAGVRSLHAIQIAQAAGLACNQHYGGGFQDWVHAGEPVGTGY